MLLGVFGCLIWLAGGCVGVVSKGAASVALLIPGLLVFAAAWRGAAMPCAFGAGPGVCGRGGCRFVACMLGGVSRVPWPFRGCGGLGLMGCEVESSARARFAFRGLSCWEVSVTLYLWFRF